MYELVFSKKRVKVSSDHQKMKTEIARVFPGNEKGYDRFLKKEKQRFERMYPCLQKEYSSPTAYLRPVFLKAIPYLSLNSTIYEVLSTYFNKDLLRLTFTFQSKYLGMSAWECPGAFTMIPVSYTHLTLPTKRIV